METLYQKTPDGNPSVDILKKGAVLHVLVEGTLLKSNMVTPGSEFPKVVPEVIAEYTVHAMLRTMSAVIPAIMFLSSGQSEGDAILNLNAMITLRGKKPGKSQTLNATSKLIGKKPWSLSFSFSQAHSKAS